tara:strand:+ start:527 stop:733 length:207 start_codon:yes stop_codon:yes gene_type:complete
MTNMSYCKFQNTESDLRDCEEFLHDTNLSEDENRARIDLIMRCKDIAKDFDSEDIEGYFADNKEGDEE